MSKKIFEWTGEFTSDNIFNLKALCYDLECRYLETYDNEKTYFKLKLDEIQSLRLAATIRKYGLSLESPDGLTADDLYEQLKNDIPSAGEV